MYRLLVLGLYCCVGWSWWRMLWNCQSFSSFFERTHCSNQIGHIKKSISITRAERGAWFIHGQHTHTHTPRLTNSYLGKFPIDKETILFSLFLFHLPKKQNRVCYTLSETCAPVVADKELVSLGCSHARTPHHSVGLPLFLCCIYLNFFRSLSLSAISLASKLISCVGEWILMQWLS